MLSITHPVTVTAAQARALRSGTVAIIPIEGTGRVKVRSLVGSTNGEKSGDAHIYLDPTTHLPFEEVDQPGTAHQQVIHVSLRKLPITRETERLVSLHALHPTARIDRSHQDYLRAAGGTQIYGG